MEFFEHIPLKTYKPFELSLYSGKFLVNFFLSIIEFISRNRLVLTGIFSKRKRIITHSEIWLRSFRLTSISHMSYARQTNRQTIDPKTAFVLIF
jgi:hypothetical protein